MIKACVLCGVCISVFLTPVQAKEEVVQGVVQVQDDTGKPLEGAAFQLISYGEPLQELTSDKTGRIVLHDLDYGEYQLIQTQTDYGYQKTKQRISFVYDGTQEKKQSWKVVNERMLGTVKLRIRQENDEKISHVSMELQDEQGKKLRNITSDRDSIELQKLPIGTYRLHLDEKEKDYRLKEDVTFAITPYNYNRSYVLTLHLEPVKQTQEDYTFAFCFIMAVLGLFAWLIYFFRKQSLTQFLDGFMV